MATRRRPRRRIGRFNDKDKKNVPTFSSWFSMFFASTQRVSDTQSIDIHSGRCADGQFP